MTSLAFTRLRALISRSTRALGMTRSLTGDYFVHLSPWSKRLFSKTCANIVACHCVVRVGNIRFHYKQKLKTSFAARIYNSKGWTWAKHRYDNHLFPVSNGICFIDARTVVECPFPEVFVSHTNNAAHLFQLFSASRFLRPC